MSEITRRELLGIAAGAAVVAGCAPGPREEQRVEQARATLGADAIEGMGRLEGLHWDTRDPFLFCAHHDDRYPPGNGRLGPAAPLHGRRIGHDFEGLDGWRMYHGREVPGFPSHPHRGFETVTVVRRGLLDHADSMGAAARYGVGDVQWLTAGDGIQHAEMFPLVRQDGPNPVELFQIWLNLPRADKRVAPHFSMLWSERIPRRVLRDAHGGTTELTVVAGRYQDASPLAPPPSSWASKEEAEVTIWTMKMSPGARWVLPPASRGVDRRLYFHAGHSLSVGGRTVAVRYYLDLRGDAAVSLINGPSTSELLLLAGRPLREPVARYGPFVMNTQEEIREAFADYRRTRFGGWPWPSEEPVHGYQDARFARHADGRTETPT